MNLFFILPKRIYLDSNIFLFYVPDIFTQRFRQLFIIKTQREQFTTFYFQIKNKKCTIIFIKLKTKA